MATRRIIGKLMKQKLRGLKLTIDSPEKGRARLARRTTNRTSQPPRPLSKKKVRAKNFNDDADDVEIVEVDDGKSDDDDDENDVETDDEDDETTFFDTKKVSRETSIRLTRPRPSGGNFLRGAGRRRKEENGDHPPITLSLRRRR